MDLPNKTAVIINFDLTSGVNFASKVKVDVILYNGVETLSLPKGKSIYIVFKLNDIEKRDDSKELYCSFLSPITSFWQFDGVYPAGRHEDTLRC